jgi:hypothetical protein
LGYTEFGIRKGDIGKDLPHCATYADPVVGFEVGGKTGYSVGGKTGRLVGASVGAPGKFVGNADGDTEGEFDVGNVVGKADGIGVGNFEGNAEGLNVGSSDGADVGDCVGSKNEYDSLIVLPNGSVILITLLPVHTPCGQSLIINPIPGK